MKDSTREIARVAVPVSFEFVVMLGLNFVNQIIVGSLGAIAIAAVGFSNSLTFILIVTISALGTSVGVMVSRAFGGGKLHEVNITVTVAIALAAVTTVFFSVFLFLWPHEILAATGASAKVASAGVDYLRFMSLSLLPAILSAVLSGVLRSTENAKLPMHATIITVIMNVLLGYALVFGLWIFPEMGVAGAGLATLLTTTLKAVILFVQTFFTRNIADIEFPEDWAHWVEVIKPLFVLAIPLGLTELIWTLGIFGYNVIIQRIGDLELAAAQIANTLEGIFIVGSVGLAVAATALIGRSVGAQDRDGIFMWIKQIRGLGNITGLLFASMYAMTVFSLDTLFKNAGEDVRNAAVGAILLNAAVQVVKVRNMINAGGVLTSGSDVRGVIWGDVIGSIVVGIPAAVILGLWLEWGLMGVIVARSLDEIAKFFIFGFRSRRINWDALLAEHK
jgi:putative MATE family efflux protein